MVLPDRGLLLCGVHHPNSKVYALRASCQGTCDEGAGVATLGLRLNTVRRRVALVAENTKGNVGGDIIIPEKLRWKITRYRAWCARRELPVNGDAPMLVSRHHRRISVRRVQQVWRAVQVKAGIDRHYRFHGLRHYFGTTVYTATKDIRLTQVAMRHQAVSSTMIYTHVSERAVETAIEDLF